MERTRGANFQGPDCDSGHYLVFAKYRERFALIIQRAQRFNGERFNLRKLNDLEFRRQYQIETINRCAGLGN